MLGLFGYMNFLIFYKWCIDWRAPTAPGAPPNLIDTLISIVLKPGDVTDPRFDSQVSLQVFLVLIVFLSVPTMLIPKPLILLHQHKQELKRKAAGMYAIGCISRRYRCACVLSWSSARCGVVCSCPCIPWSWSRSGWRRRRGEVV